MITKTSKPASSDPRIVKTNILNLRVLNSFFAFCIFISLCIEVRAQDHEMSILNPNSYGQLESDRFYDGLMQMIEGNNSLSYLAGFPRFVGIDREHALRNGEGQNNYILEANLNQEFQFYRGRMGNIPFWQTFSLGITYQPTIRLSKDADSNPAMPLNNRAGIRINKGIWHNYKKVDLQTLDEEKFDLKEDHELWYVYSTLNASHYSNGMRSGRFLDEEPEDEGGRPILRNDYADGNFSTNYTNLIFTASRLKNNEMATLSLGYQIEFGFDGVAEFSGKNSYGNHRLLNMLQYRFEPHKLLFARNESFKWYDFHAKKMVEIRNLAEFRIRMENTLIIDREEELLNFPHENLYRFSSHLYLEYNPWKWRQVGMFLHFYHGRDYLNIRFDDVVFAAMLGISVDFKKWIPPFMKPCKFQSHGDCTPFTKERKIELLQDQINQLNH